MAFEECGDEVMVTGDGGQSDRMDDGQCSAGLVARLVFGGCGPTDI